MTESSQGRIENSLNDDALANILEQQFGVSRASVPAHLRLPTQPPARVPVTTSAAPGSSWNSTVEAPQDCQPPDKSAGGGLGDLGGGMFGKSFKQAAGAAVMALLASIAMKALSSSSSKGASQSGARLFDDMAEQRRPPEQPQAQSIADLTVKAMINAAKADGRIDEDEMQKIVGEMQSDAFTQEEQDFLMSEVRKPMCTAEIVRAVPNPQVGAQIYAASILAIEVDSPAEVAYLQQFARDVGLNSKVVEEIHSVLGVPQ
jgi:uncharacterized membrane protein YebE (DUF533 family)